MRARRILAVTGALALSGCGAASGLIGAVAGAAPGATAQPLSAAGFAPEAVAAAPQDYMLIQVATRGIAGLAVQANANGDVQTWIGETGYSLTLEDGLLVATRGLGDDLIAANTAGVRAALRQGGGATERQHDYLDARDRIRTETYTCTIAPQGPQEVDLGIRAITAYLLTETCANDRIQFENQYFVDETGTILAARQFVSQTVAYLRNNGL